MTRVKVTDGSKLKTDDTEPPLSVALVKNNGVPKVLSDYEVTFQMREAGDTDLIVDDDTSGNVSVSDADLGQVSYNWQPGDTSTAATYECEFTIEGEVGTSEEGSVLTFPNQGFFAVQIEEGL